MQVLQGHLGQLLGIAAGLGVIKVDLGAGAVKGLVDFQTVLRHRADQAIGLVANADSDGIALVGTAGTVGPGAAGISRDLDETILGTAQEELKRFACLGPILVLDQVGGTADGLLSFAILGKADGAAEGRCRGRRHR